MNRDELIRHLRAAGHGAAVDLALSPDTLAHGDFARADATEAEARAGLEGLLKVFERQRIDAETESLLPGNLVAGRGSGKRS